MEGRQAGRKTETELARRDRGASEDDVKSGSRFGDRAEGGRGHPKIARKK